MKFGIAWFTIAHQLSELYFIKLMALSPVHDLYGSLTMRDCPFPFFFVPKCLAMVRCVYGNEWMAMISCDWDPPSFEYLNSLKK